MRLIEREALPLVWPDKAALRTTYERIKSIHAGAYGWEPPDLPSAGLAQSRRLRSYVRRWVNEWDLLRLYPGVDLTVEAEEEAGPAYTEDTALEHASETGLIE